MHISSLYLSKQEVRKKGFTIVEMLVVIAIILFLTALLMPTLSRVRETAKASKCVSNLRQVSMATFLYAADNEGLAPYDQYALKSSNQWYFTTRSRDSNNACYDKNFPQNKWFSEYLPAGGIGHMNAVGLCPSGGRFDRANADLPDMNNPGKFVPNTSYVINIDLICNDFFWDNKLSDRRDAVLQMIKNPEKVMLWSEGLEANVISGNMGRDKTMTGPHFAREKKSAPVTPTVGNYLVFQKMGKAHVIYVDQHIGTFNYPEELPDWNTQFWNFTSDKPNPLEN